MGVTGARVGLGGDNYLSTKICQKMPHSKITASEHLKPKNVDCC